MMAARRHFTHRQLPRDGPRREGGLQFATTLL
jgi:hypothetical protein